MRKLPIRSIVAAALIVFVFHGMAAVHAQNLGYAKQPTITEYDADPNWPQIPDHIGRKGWVSGLAIDDQDQVWFFKKGDEPVQVYTADGKFVRSWGKALFVQPHQLRIDHEGNIWVADFGLHVVQKFTPEGNPGSRCRRGCLHSDHSSRSRGL